MSYAAPEIAPPLRVLLLGASGPGWYTASDDERRERALPRLTKVCAQWCDMGARLLSSFDDDALMVGEPAGGAVTWYLLYEVPSLQTVADMLNLFRVEEHGARLDRWFRLEARIGRAFFPVEPPG